MIGSWIIALNFITTSCLTIIYFWVLFFLHECALLMSKPFDSITLHMMAGYFCFQQHLNKILFLEIILLIVIILILIACNWYWIITFNWIVCNIINGYISLQQEFSERKKYLFVTTSVCYNKYHFLYCSICFFPLQQLLILQHNEHVCSNCLLAIFVVTCIFFIVVIVHLSNSSFLHDFLFFTIYCRDVISIVVQLSPRCRKLKHYIFPISLEL